MNGLMKRLSAVAMAVGILMATNISYLSTEPFIANAAESETSDTEQTVHIWDGTTDISWYDDEETEFHISTPEQLAGMAAIVNTGKTMEGKTFILDNDIYLNDVSTYDEWETTPPENKWTPVNKFSGTFLGENHSIIGLYSDSGFIDTTSNASISDLNLEDIYITYNVDDMVSGRCTISLGGLVASSSDSHFNNCCIYGEIKANIKLHYAYNANGDILPFYHVIYIAGLIGESESDKIIGCSNYVNIDVYDYIISSSDVGSSTCYCVGGVCGKANSFAANCLNAGTINATNLKRSNMFGIGGIFGYSGNIITNCKNIGDINGCYNCGGICGYNVNNGKILNSYNTGKVSWNSEKIDSKKNRGNGICGYNSGTVKNVYNIGMIEDGYAIASNESSGTISNAYYLSGTALEGGPNTTAKIKDNMKKESFADSLGEAFYYVEGEYPKLAFEVGRTVSNFDKTSLSFNEYGETQTLTLDTTYLGTPEWVSSDTSVATVDENGVVTAVGNGTAMIYALCSDSKAACSVSVGYDYYLSDNELSLKKGRVHDLTVYSASTNEEVTDVEIEWNSSDDSIVSVDNEGKLIANNKGTAAVTAKIADIELSCIVNVYEYTVPVTPTKDDKNAPQLSETEFTISTIESKKLSVLNYTDSITWVSSNTTIAKVNDQGLVRAVAEGQTSVYALLSDGKCLKANVTVTKSEYSMGDINLDGEFDVADVVLLQKWLLAVSDTKLKHWENADFYEDGMLNVFDLCMMREQLIS